MNVISRSFNAFIECGTSRSTAKLKPLHGAIAKDIAARLGRGYNVISQGYADDKEGTIKGRYIDKKVDITITKNDEPIAGIAVKFVMQNYSQNSNNYFENMLGETANIRSNHCPYFQLFIILDKLPYYKKDKTISKWENFTSHNIHKYLILSKDDADVYYHTPNKTLLYIIHIPDNDEIKTLKEYMDYYSTHKYTVELSQTDIGQYEKTIIVNDYEMFINKVYHTIKAL